MRRAFATVGVVLIISGSALADAGEYLKKIKAVGGEGAGNAAASTAWKQLVELGPGALLPTLAAMDDAKIVAANWLRLAAEAIVEKQEQAGRPLPLAELETFVKDTSHVPGARRLAYDFLITGDPRAPARLLPGMIHDPSVEIRRDAIAAALETAVPLIKKDPEKAAVELRALFEASRDQDQAEKIAKSLKELAIDADLNRHFGVITDWFLAGPFDTGSSDRLAPVFAPETAVDLRAVYKGKNGAEIKWIPHASTEAYAIVDLNKAIGKHKDAAAYGYAAIDSPKEQLVELRFGSVNGIKVFLNGKEVYSREEYHHGQRLDQYRAVAPLKTGQNQLLVKISQNNQTEMWAQDWKFQMRICDSTGGPVDVKLMKALESLQKGSQ